MFGLLEIPGCEWASCFFCKKAKAWVGLSTVHRDQDKGRLFELKNWGLEVISGSNFKI